MERILVSACLLGEAVRYDGSAALWQPPAIWEVWRTEQRLLPFCAECAAGFPVPRPSAERVAERVIEQTGTDVTAQFRRGAELALAFARQNALRIAVLKEKSPSCGVNAIYDGSFTGRTLSGMGVVAALLRENGIQVFSEHQVTEAQAFLESLH